MNNFSYQRGDIRNIDDFIKQHNHIRYCEVIIHRNGDIEDCRPNHIETLIRISDKDRDEIYNSMTLQESPLHWLLKDTGCVSVWYSYQYSFGELSEQQQESLNKLVENRIIEDNMLNLESEAE